MKETTNLKLKLYDTADAPNLVAGYNASMEAIDKASAEWGGSGIPENAVYADGSILQSPSGTNMAGVSVNVDGSRAVSLRGVGDNMCGLVASTAGNVHEGYVAVDTGGNLIVQGEDDVYLSFASTNVKATELKAALSTIASLESEVESLKTQLAAKADTATVTALTTRVATAEGEIDTLQTGLTAATAAGTAQLTVADLTAAKTNTKNLVTA